MENIMTYKTLAEHIEDREIYEQLDRGNNTGFKTSDLVRIKEISEKNEWSEAMTLEEAISYIDSL